MRSMRSDQYSSKEVKKGWQTGGQIRDNIISGIPKDGTKSWRIQMRELSLVLVDVGGRHRVPIIEHYSSTCLRTERAGGRSERESALGNFMTGLLKSEG